MIRAPLMFLRSVQLHFTLLSFTAHLWQETSAAGEKSDCPGHQQVLLLHTQVQRFCVAQPDQQIHHLSFDRKTHFLRRCTCAASKKRVLSRGHATIHHAVSRVRQNFWLPTSRIFQWLSAYNRFEWFLNISNIYSHFQTYKFFWNVSQIQLIGNSEKQNFDVQVK